MHTGQEELTYINAGDDFFGFFFALLLLLFLLLCVKGNHQRQAQPTDSGGQCDRCPRLYHCWPGRGPAFLLADQRGRQANSEVRSHRKLHQRNRSKVPRRLQSHQPVSKSEWSSPRSLANLWNLILKIHCVEINWHNLMQSVKSTRQLPYSRQQATVSLSSLRFKFRWSLTFPSPPFR